MCMVILIQNIVSNLSGFVNISDFTLWIILILEKIYMSSNSTVGMNLLHV